MKIKIPSPPHNVMTDLLKKGVLWSQSKGLKTVKGEAKYKEEEDSPLKKNSIFSFSAFIITPPALNPNH